MLCEKLGIEVDCNEKNGESEVENENEDGAEEGEEGKKEGDIFKNFVPAFFQTLQTYFPSTASPLMLHPHHLIPTMDYHLQQN